MMTERIPVSDIETIKSTNIIFDANIWLYLYGPNAYPTNRLTKMYSCVYSKAIKNENTVIIDSTIISEFSNRYIRIHHDILKQSGSPDDYKVFRSTQEFKDICEELHDVILNIIDDCTVAYVDASEIDYEYIFSEISKGEMDYGDMIVTSLCDSRGYYLLTHDSDFNNAHINIITGNPKML